MTRKVREGWDYKRIMAITGHKTFSVFQRYNNMSADDLREVVEALGSVGASHTSDAALDECGLSLYHGATHGT